VVAATRLWLENFPVRLALDLVSPGIAHVIFQCQELTTNEFGLLNAVLGLASIVGGFTWTAVK
jgi:hypothetical protein